MTMSIAVQQLKKEKRRMRYEFLDTEIAQCGNERGPASSDHNHKLKEKNADRPSWETISMESPIFKSYRAQWCMLAVRDGVSIVPQVGMRERGGDLEAGKIF